MFFVISNRCKLFSSHTQQTHILHNYTKRIALKKKMCIFRLLFSRNLSQNFANQTVRMETTSGDALCFQANYSHSNVNAGPFILFFVCVCLMLHTSCVLFSFNFSSFLLFSSLTPILLHFPHS